MAGAQRALQERRAFCAEVAAQLKEEWRPAAAAAAKRRMQRCNAVRAWHGGPLVQSVQHSDPQSPSYPCTEACVLCSAVCVGCTLRAGA